MLWQAGAVVAAALVAGLVTWLVARRTASGSTQTSDAATLWQAAEGMRQELREEVVQQRGEIARLRERVAILEREVERLRARARGE